MLIKVGIVRHIPFQDFLKRPFRTTHLLESSPQALQGSYRQDQTPQELQFRKPIYPLACRFLEVAVHALWIEFLALQHVSHEIQQLSPNILVKAWIPNG